MRLTIPSNESGFIGQPLQAQNTVGISQGVESVAKVTEQITGHLLQVAQEERDALTRNRSAQFYAEYGDHQDTLKTEVFNDVRGGVINVEDATDVYKKRSDEWVKGRLTEYDDITKKQIEPNLPIFGLKALSDVRDQQSKLVSEDFAKGIYQIGESYSRMAVKNPNDAITQYEAYINFAAPKAGVNDVTKAKMVQDFKEKAWFENKAFIIENTNSYGQLKALRENLRDVNNVADLTREGRRALISSTEQKLNKMDADEKARRREAEQQRNEQARFIIDTLLGGEDVAPDILKQANIIGKGSDPIAKAMQGALSSYTDIRKMSNSTIQKQADLVIGAKAAIANESDPQKSAILQDKYKVLAGAYERNAKAIMDDVWAYDEMRTGKAHPIIDFNKPIAPQMAENKKIADAIYARTGIPAPLIRKSQVEDLNRFITTLNPDKQAEFLGSIVSVGGKDAAMATIRQIGVNDKRLASIALHAVEGNKTQSGKPVASMLARGFQIIQNKETLKAMNPSKDFYTAFNKDLDEKFGGMFFYDNPELKAVYHDNIMAVYMYMASQKGISAQDIDNDVFDMAVNVATGGVVKYNGLITIPPYGMDEGKFGDKADVAIRDVLKNSALADDKKEFITDNARLVPFKNGGYYLRLNGELQIDPKTRQPYQVFIK